MIKLLIRTAYFLVTLTSLLHAQVPQLISYQGRVGVDGVNFDGLGQFKFAFVNAAGTETYWSNDGSSRAGSEPGAAITLPVNKGLYSILLGDATQAHMSIVPATVFTNGDVHLRVWFNDGVNGFQQLAPDRRIAAVGYAMIADSVSDGAITTAKIADGAVTSDKLAAGVVQSLSLKAPIASPTFTGSVTLPAGSTTTAPLMLQTGTNLTTPVMGAVEFDGANVYVTNNSANPTRKTVAFTDTMISANQIADGSVTSAKLANGSIGSAQLAAGAVGSTQLASGAAAANLNAAGQTGVPSGGLVLSATENPALIAAGFIQIGSTLTTVAWQPRWSADQTPPIGRLYTTGVWTGSELLVWGGSYNNPSIGQVAVRNGGCYNPTSNVWTLMTSTGAPGARRNHTAVWSGTEMIVWGGERETSTNPLNDGGLYNPNSNSWRSMTGTGAPSARINHSAIWTGTEMIIWGGYANGVSLNTGSRYNPLTNTWTATNLAGAPLPRTGHTAIWTGSEMIVWGGNPLGSGNALNEGGRYNPTTNTWIIVNGTGSPDRRTGHRSLWTGSEMVVWGGGNYFNNGGIYSPTTDTWRAVNDIGAPTGRSGHSAVWTGSEMIVWGGDSIDGYINDGGRYNPITNAWTSVLMDAPQRRQGHVAVWTGSQMILWGGLSSGGTSASYLNDTFSYTPSRLLYLFQRP